MSTAVVIGDELEAAPEVTAWRTSDDDLSRPGHREPADLVTEVIGSPRFQSDAPATVPVVTMADDDDEGDEEEFESVETPDFEGLEDFDDEDFDDEFDDDFEEELEDEYDFDEFDERVTEEDLEEAEGELPLVGDFVDEDAEEEPAPAPAEDDEQKESEAKPKKGKKKSKED